jgi:hypothetical protein
VSAVTTMPKPRLVEIPRRSPMSRGLLLAWLAECEIETPELVPPAIVSDTLAGNAAESLTGEALTQAWQRYLSCIREWRDAKERPVTWRGLPKGMTGLGMARCNAQAALHYLVHGEGR